MAKKPQVKYNPTARTEPSAATPEPEKAESWGVSLQSTEWDEIEKIAAELNMTQDALLERLFMMERLGYVVRSGGCEEKPHTETPSCCCSGCSCSGGGIYSGSVNAYADGLTLTGTWKCLDIIRCYAIWDSEEQEFKGFSYAYRFQRTA